MSRKVYENMLFQRTIRVVLVFCASMAGFAQAVSVTDPAGVSSDIPHGGVVSADVAAQASEAFKDAADPKLTRPARRVVKQPSAKSKNSDPGIKPIALDVYTYGSRPKDMQQEVMDNIIIGLSCEDDINAITAEGLEYREVPDNFQIQQANAMNPFVLLSMLVCLVSVAYFVFKNKFMPRRGFDY